MRFVSKEFLKKENLIKSSNITSTTFWSWTVLNISVASLTITSRGSSKKWPFNLSSILAISSLAIPSWYNLYSFYLIT